MIEEEKKLMKATGGAVATKHAAAKETQCGPHLLKPDDIVGFPKFPAGTKSLLMKFLTPEIWEKYKDKKDKYGNSFKACILSGCQNTDSGVGVYAYSHDSYHAFSEFFDHIIESYHGVKQHVKEIKMDSSKLNAPPFAEADAKMIVSTRIRVGRNLDGIPLRPGITND